jgi:hypothetical protein
MYSSTNIQSGSLLTERVPLSYVVCWNDMRKDGNSADIGLKYLLALQSTVSCKQLSKRVSKDKNSNFSIAFIMNH